MQLAFGEPGKLKSREDLCVGLKTRLCLLHELLAEEKRNRVRYHNETSNVGTVVLPRMYVFMTLANFLAQPKDDATKAFSSEPQDGGDSGGNKGNLEKKGSEAEQKEPNNSDDARRPQEQ